MAGIGMGNMRSGGGRTGDVIPSGYKTGQMQNFTPEQMQLFQSSFSHLGPDSYLSRLAGGDQSLFNQIESPALQQMSAGLGNIASRFSQGSGQGSMGTRRSSGFGQETSSAMSNFAQQLQAQRQGLQRQAIEDLMSYSQMLMGQQPYERFLEKKKHKPKWWESLLGTVSPIAGDIYEGGTRNTQNFMNVLGSGGGGGGGF